MEDIILHGDVYACLKNLGNNSITVAVTSPPYWNQRNYGFDGQIGREKTPEEYIGRLITVFGVLKDKLCGHGIFFLNVGDKYLGRYGKSHLLQIPYRLAYHMIKDGWYLEDIIIWYKPNHMPSSVKDRFTNTYEPVLVFAKRRSNIYKKGSEKVLGIPLQQTPWKHTAVFPEKLVEVLLKRTDIKEGDTVLDPFAGTGTVASVVKNMRGGLLPKAISSIMIEKGDHFIDIIKKRIQIKKTEKIEDIPYVWKSVKEEDLPDEIEPLEIKTDRHGEVFIAGGDEDFLSALRGITSEGFKKFHRDDALYFFGTKKFTIRSLYYIHSIFYNGYVLRNMLVVSEGDGWYPIFMFAKDTTTVEYKFYLDRVRIKPKSAENRVWYKEEFIGKKVRDISRKKTQEGEIIAITERYGDGFPKIVIVRWNGYVSAEFVLHPCEDEFIMEGLIYRSPECGSILEEPYDPVGENRCPGCKGLLWTDMKTVPEISEPEKVREVIDKLKNIKCIEFGNSEKAEIKKPSNDKNKKTVSKFSGLERINWGASPGARKIMLGEYFTKMRLYRIDQPTVARYLTLLRKDKGLSIKDITERLPPSYKHTVGHWFRRDFGGSIPIPEDIPLLKQIFGENGGLLDILERTALKFQTVRASVKGKNPGDFIDVNNIAEPVHMYLKKLYIPPYKYIELMVSE